MRKRSIKVFLVRRRVVAVLAALALAAGRRRFAPEVATMTGSTTI